MNAPQAEKSKLITWSTYIGLTALLALPLAVLMVRSGVWQQGLMLFALGCAVSALLLLVFIVLLVLPGFKVHRSTIFSRVLTVLPGTALLLSLVGGSGDYPAIHDVSTDTQNPPLFSVALAERGSEANPLSIKPESIAAQKMAYPNLATVRNSASVQANFTAALATAELLGWEIYHSDADSGIIEAVDTTAVMAFKDDIVIRVRAQGDDTVVDLRSVSRVGRGDLGANAKRIQAFQSAFNP